MNVLHSFGTLNGQQVCPPVQLLGGRWRLSSSFPGYFQCLSNAACSLFDSQMWTKTVWICRRRGVRAFLWYHSLGPPVFLCSPAVFFSVPPAVLSWPSFFSCFHPRTPAALSRNPLTSLHSFKKTRSCIHSGMPASVCAVFQPASASCSVQPGLSSLCWSSAFPGFSSAHRLEPPHTDVFILPQHSFRIIISSVF